MKQLYDKNEVSFSVLWIMIYLFSISMSENISVLLGMMKVVTIFTGLLLSVILFIWIKKNGLKEYYGLCRPDIFNYREYLYFVPLILITTSNLWNGITFRFSITETILYVISMILLGSLEEIVFRGFLFKALAKNNIKTALIISSLSFGLGHIINLLRGVNFATILQICLSAAMGYLFTILFIKSKSLLPCIIAHAFINCTSVFAVIGSERSNLISTVILFVLTLGYAYFLTGHSKRQ